MNISHEFIKVVNIQLSVSINTNVTEKNLNDLVSNKPEIIGKINNAFRILEKEEPNFIIFPEYSFFNELESIFIEQSKNLNAIIISGSYVSDKLIPEAKIFQPNGNIDIIQKSELAPNEHYLFQNITLKTGVLPNIFSFDYKSNREIKFLALICFDFYSKYNEFFDKDLDLLFISAYNFNFDKFYSQLEEFCCKMPSFSIYSNAADTNAGNSAIFGIHEALIHQRNIQNQSICDGKLDYPNLIANFDQLENKMMIAELDINRPFLIRPYSVTGNSMPNVRDIRKFDL
jgi:hypothetical protein